MSENEVQRMKEIELHPENLGSAGNQEKTLNAVKQ
jgi:formylmethanofuran dehydrogenase subunit A